MLISAIVGATENDVIAKDGGIPWNLKSDLRYTNNTTMGHPIIMGRGTHDFIGKSLPGRLNVVVSHNPNYKVHEDAVLANSIEEALALPEVKKADEVFIYGGQDIYKAAMPYIQKIYLTRIHANIDGDRFFKYDPSEWKEVSKESHKADFENEYDYDFVVLERKD
jgi:dihydrofolate reductase